jgi:orotidine-5'-phosphate decarboxylase
MTAPRVPVFCAIDTIELDQARKLAHSAVAAGMGVKLGKEFFTAHGPQGVRAVLPEGAALFLDLKFHDIPNTVAGGVRAAIAGVAPFCLTVHAAGGRAILEAAVAEARRAARPPLILAVTVLTSLNEGDLHASGVAGTVMDQVKRLAASAQGAGCAGVICAAPEIAALRAQAGAEFKLVVPGIRPAGSDVGDQKRVMTPAEAMQAGASYLVIGRPITGAPDPAAAAEAIAAGIAQG